MQPEILITFEEVRRLCQTWRDEGAQVVFVPTMGALHAGHMSLVKEARSHGNRVIVSIFVNPTQFGPNEDFSRYPRPIENDIALLKEAEVDALFLPNAFELYPEGFQTYVINHEMSKILCGKTRNNHFSGVLTIVLKLLNLISPHVMLLGKKDYQQLQLISQMVQDLNLDVAIVSGETVREISGLALSSRNQYLDEAAMKVAPKIFGGLKEIKNSYKSGTASVELLIKNFRKTLVESPELRIEYIEILRQSDLKSFADGEIDQDAVALVAAHLAGVRLIDNIELNHLGK